MQTSLLQLHPSFLTPFLLQNDAPVVDRLHTTAHDHITDFDLSKKKVTMVEDTGFDRSALGRGDNNKEIGFFTRRIKASAAGYRF